MSMMTDTAATASAAAAAAHDEGWINMRATITLILLISSALMLVGFCTGLLKAPENDIVKGALGSWFTLTALGAQFYYGSNSQSKLKDETVKALASKT